VDEGPLRFSFAINLRDICLISEKNKSFAEDLSNDHTQNQTSFEGVSKIFK
jgi:hypothetical protein